MSQIQFIRNNARAHMRSDVVMFDDAYALIVGDARCLTSLNYQVLLKFIIAIVNVDSIISGYWYMFCKVRDPSIE